MGSTCLGQHSFELFHLSTEALACGLVSLFIVVKKGQKFCFVPSLKQCVCQLSDLGVVPEMFKEATCRAEIRLNNTAFLEM